MCRQWWLRELEVKRPGACAVQHHFRHDNLFDAHDSNCSHDKQGLLEVMLKAARDQRFTWTRPNCTVARGSTMDMCPGIG